MVKDGVVVIDVGMNRETSTTTKSGYKLYGDVDFEGVAPKVPLLPGARRRWPDDYHRLLKNTLLRLIRRYTSN